MATHNRVGGRVRNMRDFAFVLLVAIGMLGHARVAEANACGSCATNNWTCTELVLCAITQCCGAGSGQATFQAGCTADVRCDYDGHMCYGVDPYAC